MADAEADSVADAAVLDGAELVVLGVADVSAADEVVSAADEVAAVVSVTEVVADVVAEVSVVVAVPASAAGVGGVRTVSIM